MAHGTITPYLTLPMRLLLFLFLLPAALCAQTVSITSTATDTVRQGTLVDLSFNFENASAAAFKLPDLVGLTVVGGPSRRSQMSIVNGVRSSSEAVVYRVRADQPGLAYVPAVESKHDKETITSEPLRFFVTADPNYVAPEATATEASPAPKTARRRPTVKM